MRTLLMMLLTMIAVGCEAELACQLCGGAHETDGHVSDALSGSGGVEDPQIMAADDLLLLFVQNHRSDGFVKVNDAAYPSDVSDNSINVFVSEFAVAEYLETSPSEVMSDGMFPRGGFIVREIVDANGTPTKLTALYRGPEGYNPASNDFWFAVTDPQGRVLQDAQGHAVLGAVEGCSSCHAGRAEADFLFGVPVDYRDRSFVPQPDGPSEPTTGDEDPVTAETPNTPDVPAPERQEPPQPELVSLDGVVLANVQGDLSREQTLRLGIEVPRGTNVVIARQATRLEFEQTWGPLPEGVVFVNAGGPTGTGAPIVNGGETWELRAADGSIADGPTPAGSTAMSYHRGGLDRDAWVEASVSTATPGVVDVALPEGLWLTEWSDSENYKHEFVEIAVR